MFLQEAATIVEYFIRFRNAVEHPGGYSGELRINNFSFQSDGKIREPTWYTEKDGKPPPVSGKLSAALLFSIFQVGGIGH